MKTRMAFTTDGYLVETVMATQIENKKLSTPHHSQLILLRNEREICISQLKNTIKIYCIHQLWAIASKVMEAHFS